MRRRVRALLTFGARDERFIYYMFIREVGYSYHTIELRVFQHELEYMSCVGEECWVYIRATDRLNIYRWLEEL